MTLQAIFLLPASENFQKLSGPWCRGAPLCVHVLYMICKMPIFSYFTLKSNIHHISNITLHIYIIKIYVSSNIFELIPIVHIICKKFIKTSYFIIFHYFPPKYINFPYYTFREIPTKFPAQEKFSSIPIRIQWSNQNPTQKDGLHKIKGVRKE